MTATTEKHPYADLSTPDTDNHTIIDHDNNDYIKFDEQWSADFLWLNKRDHYEHQNNVNKGLKNGPSWWNHKYQTHFSNVDLIGIIGDTLGLTVPQRRQLAPKFTSYDLGELGLTKELVGCSLCIYLVHTDETDTRECHPNMDKNNRDEIYDQAIDHFMIFEKDLRKTYGKVEALERARERGI